MVDNEAKSPATAAQRQRAGAQQTDNGCEEATRLWHSVVGTSEGPGMRRAATAESDGLLQSMLGTANMGSHVEVHEVCCGVGSMSHELQRQGLPVAAASDTDADARAIFMERHPYTKMFDSMQEMAQWAGSYQSQRRKIVVGGPPCTALSEAGKQKFEADASSDLLIQMVEYAGIVGADMVILENVLELLDNPRAGELLKRLLQQAKQSGLRLVEVTRLKDSECGGGTQRRRGFLWFTSTWVNELVRTWPAPTMPTANGLIIEQALRKDDEVDGSVSVLDAGTLRLKQPRPIVTSTRAPIITGWMHIHPEIRVHDTVTLRYSGKVGTVRSQQKEGYEVQLAEGGTLTVKVEQIDSVSGDNQAQRIRGGQYVQLKGSKDKWKVMSVSQTVIQLRKSDRENPKARRVHPDSIVGWCVEKEPIYSRQSIGIGLRRFGEPVQQNSFLILCPELGVRRLYGDEMWRLHGQDAVHTAVPHYRLGELAGNAVTSAMARVIAKMTVIAVCQALKAVQKQTPTLRDDTASRDSTEEGDNNGGKPGGGKRKATQQGTPTRHPSTTRGEQSWIDVTAGEQRQGTRRVLLLLVSSEERPRVTVKEQGRLMLGKDAEADSRWHKEGKQLAITLKEALGVNEGVVELAHQFRHDKNATTLLMYSVVQHRELPDGIQWLEPEHCRAGEKAYLYATLVVQAMLQVAPPGGVFDDGLWHRAQKMGIHTTETSGAVRAALVGDKLADEKQTTRTAEEVNELLSWCDDAQHDLEAHLRAADLPLWADMITPVPREALMVNALRNKFDPDDARLADAVAEDRCIIPETEPVKYEDYFQARDPDPSFKPTKLEHLLKPWAIREIDNWVRRNLKHLQRCREFRAGQISEEECTREDNVTLALGENAFWPQAWGVPWDLRRMSEGIITVFQTDVDTKACSPLNVGWLAEEMQKRQLPDHQLRDFLLHGVSYCANLGWQIVLSPHLLSLKEGYPQIVDEMESNVQRNWHRFYDHIPLLPFRGIPNGARGRPKDPKRPRPLKEAGAPRDKGLTDTAGAPVESPNVASKAPLAPEAEEETTSRAETKPRPPKWPKEHKPWVKDALMMMATLVHLASILGEVVYAVGDDAKNYFNQLRLHPSQYPYMGTFCDTAQNTPRWCVNQVVEFGIAPASNIAQRLSNVLMRIFADTFEESEKENVEQLRRTNARFEAWFQHRKSLSRAAGRTLHRLFGNLMYTDDPLLLCCGAARTTRMVKCWEWCIEKSGLWMANPIKRSIGVHIEWLGVAFLVALAVAWLPRHKAIKAMSQVTQAKEGKLPLQDYRKLLGRLANYMFVLSLAPKMMAGLWRPLKGNWDPGAMVVLGTYIAGKLDEWLTFLTTVAAITAARVVLGATLSQVANVLTVTVDACKEGEGTPGLGVYLHGMYARAPLHGDYMLLPIAVLEFIANIMALVAFRDILLQHIAGGGYVHLRTDAVSPAWALQKQHAKSPLMLHVLEYVQGRKDLRDLWKGLVVSQLFGERNTAADAVSRGLWLIFDELCRQLKVKAQEVPADVEQLLVTTLAKQLDLIKDRDHRQAQDKKEAQWRQRSLKRLQEAQLKRQSKLGTTATARDKAVEQGRAVQCASARANSGSEPNRLLMQPPDDSEEDEPPAMQLGQQRSRVVKNEDSSMQKELSSPMTRKRSRLAMAPPPDSAGNTPTWKTELRALRAVSEGGPTRRSPRRNALELQEQRCSTGISWLQRQDRGKYSFGANNPGLVAMYEKIMGRVMQHCIPLTVQSTMKSHIKRWRQYCEGLDTTPVRDDVTANLGIDRQGYEDELMLLGYAAIDALQDMQPRAGRKAPLPDSAKSYLYSVRDWHASMMPPIEMVRISAIAKMFKALNSEYKALYGVRDMIKKQREPFKRWHVRKLLTFRSFKAGKKQWLQGSLTGDSVMAMIATQANTAMRKSEVTLPEAFTQWNKSLINWGSVKWKIGGKYYPELTLELYMALGKGDYLILTPPPAKADPFCKVWGGRPIYIRYDPEGGVNAAYWIAELEHRHPVLLKDREDTPLFRDEKGAAIKASWWSKTLHQMLTTFMNEAEAKRYSTHSFRIYLACAAYESKAKPEEIQALCRWRSAESLRTYVRWSEHVYADMVEAAMAVEIDPLHTTNLPHLDPGALIQAVADVE